MTTARGLALAIAACLLVAAALFVLVVVRGSDGEAPSSATESTIATIPTTPTTAATVDDDVEVTVVGLDLESPAVVAFTVLMAFVLAALAVVMPTRPLWVVILIYGLVAMVFDMGAIAKHISEDRMGTAGLAGLVALLHFATAAMAGWLLGRRPIEASLEGEASGH